MTAAAPKSLPAIGFLTIEEHAKYGLLGGYLVLNTSGRPLEFHCTAPVRANRAQEILYGPTLKPYLYGEQIGQTLVEKARAKPQLVCIDVEPAMALRDHCSIPVLLVTDLVETAPAPTDAAPTDSGGEAGPGSSGRASLQAASPSPRLAPFSLAGRRVAVCGRHAADVEKVQAEWSRCDPQFDLDEPFERIREAIEEAHKSRKAA